MIAPNVAAASLAAADHRRVVARDDEYLSRYGAEDTSDAMARALQAFPWSDRTELAELAAL